MGIDQTEQRKSAIASVLARHLAVGDLDVPLALAREILNVLPELHILDQARRQDANTQAVMAQLIAELERRSWDAPLPPPGTTLSRAFQAEGDVLRRTGTKSGTYAAGFAAGRDAFLRSLDGRVAILQRSRENHTRPHPAHRPIEPGNPNQRPSDARRGLADRLADLPTNPQQRRQYQRTRVASELMRYSDYSGVRSSDAATAIAEVVLLALPDLDRLHETLNNLTKSEEALLDRRRQLAEAQAESGLTDKEIRWRNALASELRTLADGVPANAGHGDPFTIGFNSASQGMARKLRGRADEIAVFVVPAIP